MISQITIDCIPFVSILITVLSFFSAAFFVLKVPGDVTSVGDSFFHTYLMGVLADFDLGEFENSGNPFIAKAMFLLLSIILTIILLNLLIALMGARMSESAKHQSSTCECCVHNGSAAISRPSRGSSHWLTRFGIILAGSS